MCLCKIIGPLPSSVIDCLLERARNRFMRELMAKVFSVQKWHHYLLGSRFTVRTDQHSLKYLLEQRLINPDCQKWMTKLMGFNFDIQYRPGLENKAADALSRVPSTDAPSLLSPTLPYPADLDQLAK